MTKAPSKDQPKKLLGYSVLGLVVWPPYTPDVETLETRGREHFHTFMLLEARDF